MTAAAGRVRAVIQARMSSTRLPGKSLAEVGGEPMLGLLLARLSEAASIDATTVATSTGAEDDAIEAFCRDRSVAVVRGQLEDVLGRFLLALQPGDAAVVRITADCPLTDPALVDEIVALYRSDPGCRYAHNVEPRTFPDGLDVEVVDARALEEAARATSEPADREHVTPYIRNNPDRFPARALTLDPDLGELRWTVDRPDDLEFVRRVVERLGDRRRGAGWREILDAVHEQPSLAAFHGVRGESTRP